MTTYYDPMSLSPVSPDQMHNASSYGPSETSSAALITPSDEHPILSYESTLKAQPHQRSSAYEANQDKQDSEVTDSDAVGRVYRTTALDALEEDIYLRRQKSSGGHVNVSDYTSPSNSSSSHPPLGKVRHYTRSLRETKGSPPTPPPKDLYLDVSNLRSPASQYSPVVNDTPKGNHRRTLSARELIKVFDQADARLLPPDNGSPRRAAVSRLARSNHRTARSSPVSPAGHTRPHSSYTVEVSPTITSWESSSPRTPPKQTRLLSPLSFSSPRKKSKPLLHNFSSTGAGTNTHGSSSSLNSMMAAVLAPSSSSGSGGMGTSVKNGFQSLLGVFSPAARRRKKRSMENLEDLAEEGFVVDRSGRGIALSVSSVRFYFRFTLPLCLSLPFSYMREEER